MTRAEAYQKAKNDRELLAIKGELVTLDIELDDATIEILQEEAFKHNVQVDDVVTAALELYIAEAEKKAEAKKKAESS